MIDANQTLGLIATTTPAATPVFLKHRLDFCCGGGRKLEDACRDAGLDPQVVLDEIARAGTPTPPQRWDLATLPQLIEFILHHYHEPLRAEVPGLIHAAKKVERVHAQKANCPHGLAEFLEQVHGELESHMGKEEQVLFPAILSGARGDQLHMPIRVMMHEHDDHGANLQRLRQLTTDFQPPPEACATWRGLYAALANLESELMQHIHLENNVLFPRALDPDETSA